MHLVCATDTHFDRVLSPKQIAASWGHEYGREGLLITGDVAEAQCLVSTLDDVAEGYGGPVYFVLGNHDLWHAGREKVHALLRRRMHTDLRWVWLTDSAVHLEKGTWLVGHDGWYDVSLGTPGVFAMNDWTLIEEFRAMSGNLGLIHGQCRHWARIAAREGRRNLQLALQNGARNIIFATHIPPFPEIVLHHGKVVNESLPYYCSKIMGDMLRAVAREHTGVQFRVLAGHTHEQASHWIEPNLLAQVGAATYGAPGVAKVLKF